MLKKLAALLMAAAMLLTMTAAGAESAQAPVTISFYSTQAGVDEETIANSYPLVYENDEVKLYAVSSRAVGRLSLHPLATAG